MQTNIYVYSLQEIFDRRDLDLSGGINLVEFTLAMHARAQKAKVRGQEIAPYREAFRLFDTKNKGYITADEAHPVLYHELGTYKNPILYFCLIYFCILILDF